MFPTQEERTINNRKRIVSSMICDVYFGSLYKFSESDVTDIVNEFNQEILKMKQERLAVFNAKKEELEKSIKELNRQVIKHQLNKE